jgi:hypothetical protein
MLIMKIPATLLALVLGGWVTTAQADFIRYEVTIAGPTIPADTSGYMVFNDTGLVPGNIFPNIVDWFFLVDGFEFTPFNTQADATGFFNVDANYNFVSDFDEFTTKSPCFSADGCQAVFDDRLLAFSQSFFSAHIIYPTDNGVNDILQITGVSVSYSDPIPIPSGSIPVPSVFGLMAIAMGALALTRRSGFR